MDSKGDPHSNNHLLTIFVLKIDVVEAFKQQGDNDCIPMFPTFQLGEGKVTVDWVRIPSVGRILHWSRHALKY